MRLILTLLSWMKLVGACTVSSGGNLSSGGAGNHWSFGLLRSPAAPAVKSSERLRSPIDAFILARLEDKGLSFSPHVDSMTFLRRVHFELVGLPPPASAIDDWANFTRVDAPERLIDRLLASPHFGERWGQHWLDVAGFCADRQHKWRYRDYVVNSVNADKPFDRFLIEQLAGDELVDWRSAEQVTPRIRELLTATGYLRCARDLASDDMTDIPEIRYATLFKTMEIFGTGVLGVTLQCARCQPRLAASLWKGHRGDSRQFWYRWFATNTS